MDKHDKHKTYEESAKRKQILSIRSSKSDNLDEWESIVTWLKGLGNGNAKDGIHQLAKNNGII